MASFSCLAPQRHPGHTFAVKSVSNTHTFLSESQSDRAGEREHEDVCAYVSECLCVSWCVRV